MNVVIRVYEPQSGHGYKGVKVGLFYCKSDKQEILLGQGYTNSLGELKLTAPTSRLPPGAGTLRQPIPVVVYLYDPGGHRCHSVNRRLTGQETRISIPVILELAYRLGHYRRKPQRSYDQKVHDWCQQWTARIKTYKLQEDLDGLCVSQLVLETLAGVSQPQTDLQKELTTRLEGLLTPVQIQAVVDYSGRARDAMRHCQIPGMGAACGPSATVQDLVDRIFLSPSGSGHSLYQALSTTAPDPEAGLTSPQKGVGFRAGFEWVKMCVDNYLAGDLTDQAKQDMVEYYPDQLDLLTQPSINRIRVWDPDLQADVRVGHVQQKELELQGLDIAQAAMRSATLSMDVDLDSDQCLVLEDDGEGRQPLVVDVKPGQKVSLRGSGFVCTKAKVVADVREWDILPDGRLQPKADVLPLAGFHGTELDVHGSLTARQPGQTAETSLEDLVVLKWPTAASREGLYRLTLWFKNESAYLSSAVQNPISCEVTTGMEDVCTQTLYFAVLPPLTSRRARVVASTVNCVDETNPESILFVNLADDIAYTAQASFGRLFFEPSTQQVGQDLAPLDARFGQHQFWQDGTNWEPNLQAFPKDPGAFQIVQLRDELVFVVLRAAEIEGAWDKAIAYAVSVAVLIAVALVLIAIIAAIVIALIATGVVTLGTAEAVLMPIAAAVIGFLLGAGFSAALAAIPLIMAAVSGEETLATILTAFSGQEIAYRLSPIRFHRVLFPGDRTAPGSLSTGTQLLSSQLEGQVLHEVFQTKALGGEYLFHLKVEIP